MYKNRRKQVSKNRPPRHLTVIEYKTICFVCTMILAGISLFLEVKDPTIWTFLGTAIGVLLGQTAPKITS